jgi:hypothetical protein
LGRENSIDVVTEQFSQGCGDGDALYLTHGVRRELGVAKAFYEKGRVGMDRADLQTLQSVVSEMLAMVEVEGYGITERDGAIDVTIAGARIAFRDPRMVPRGLEQLSAAVQSRVAFQRARDMWRAAKEPENTIPLWLIGGSHLLVRWLAWSGSTEAFRRSMVLLDRHDAAPVEGIFERRARWTIGQGPARMRVRFGQATAERIGLSKNHKAFAVFGKQAFIRIGRSALPETLISALTDAPGRNDRHRVAEVIGHSFFEACDVEIAGLRNDGDDLIIDVETRWGPLEPVPAAALAAVPPGADPLAPWKPTGDEVAALDCLVNRGRALGRT